MSHNIGIAAPELETCHWINCEEGLRIADLRGKVIALHAFQILCPGCVVHGIPQASSIRALYPRDQVEVIGLHTVFEHHDVMSIPALEVFVKEYRLRLPIAVDAPSPSRAEPRTMRKYGMRGTPTLVLIDRIGNIRVNHFGRLSDMEVGNLIGQLLQEEQAYTPKNETGSSVDSELKGSNTPSNCSEEGCALP